MPARGNAQPSKARRFLIPSREFVLSGEIDRRLWAFYLTPEQARSPATLALAYQSSIFTAPEASNLSVMINGAKIYDGGVSSPDRLTEITRKVAPGVLKEGINLIRMQATQRHRTDCTVQSTYDLWADIDPARTFLSFDDPAAGVPTRLEDLRAVGVDSTGQTSFNLVVPSLDEPTTMPVITRLTEGLALLAGTPGQAVHVTSSQAPKRAPGNQTIVVGTAAELRDILAELPEGSIASPVVRFVDDPKFGPGTLVIVGPSWQALAGAIDSLVSRTDRPPGVTRTVLPTQFWHAPDTPFLVNGGRLSFAQLGVDTQEFAGRRFRTDFTIGVPSDFYAAAYGEATILLDAAYSASVVPGSHIDVYVNDNIAATVPITTSGGSILRHLPIGITMRHFRPGVNVIALEAVLLTREDAACVAGGNNSLVKRFALFDTTEFIVPSFARVGQRPNLAATSGTGFPYNSAEIPVPLLVGTEPESLSAATTLMARLSVAAGRPIPVELVVNAGTIGDRDAIFVGPVGQLPPGLLSQVGVSEDSRTAWGEAAADAGRNPPANTEEAFDRWRDELKGRGWRGQVSLLEDWLDRNFDISLSTLRLAPGSVANFVPPGSASLLLAQGTSPGAGGTWLVATGTSPKDLEQSMRALTQRREWAQVSGRLATYEKLNGNVVTLPVSRVTFFATQPFSLTNYRMIAANWLSANILSYSASLFAVCTLLGIATSALLGTIGRRH